MTLSLLLRPSGLHPSHQIRDQRGFSLIEMAIVLVILGLLLGGMMAPLGAQHEQQKISSTEESLDDARKALLGFAQVNNYLPCPASLVSNGLPVTGGGGVCTSANGYLPNALLGLGGASRNGLLLDAWNNPIHYRLTAVNTWEYAKAPIPFPTGTAPNFQICTASTCTAAQIIASNVVAVIFSTGFDTTVVSADQAANSGGGLNFVMHEQRATPGTEFDDIVVWLARPELIYALSKTR